jgi:hypothetical protein
MGQGRSDRLADSLARGADRLGEGECYPSSGAESWPPLGLVLMADVEGIKMGGIAPPESRLECEPQKTESN